MACAKQDASRRAGRDRAHGSPAGGWLGSRRLEGRWQRMLQECDCFARPARPLHFGRRDGRGQRQAERLHRRQGDAPNGLLAMFQAVAAALAWRIEIGAFVMMVMSRARRRFLEFFRTEQLIGSENIIRADHLETKKSQQKTRDNPLTPARRRRKLFPRPRHRNCVLLHGLYSCNAYAHSSTVTLRSSNRFRAS